MDNALYSETTLDSTARRGRGPRPISFTNPQNFYRDLGRFPWKPRALTWPANRRDMDNDCPCLVPGLPAVLYKSLSSKSLQRLDQLRDKGGSSVVCLSDVD